MKKLVQLLSSTAIFLFAVLACAPSARADITVQATKSSGLDAAGWTQNADLPLTWNDASFTITPGAGGMLVVVIAGEGGATAATFDVSWNSVALTRGASAFGNNAFAFVYYLANPAGGTGPLTVSKNNDITRCGVVAMYATGVGNLGPFAVNNAASATTLSAGPTSPVSDGALVVSASGQVNGNTGFTAGSGIPGAHTRLLNIVGSSGSSAGADYLLPSGGSPLTATWTLNAGVGAGGMSAAIASFEPAGPADIRTFDFGTHGPATITGTNIAVIVPYGTDVTALTPTYTLSPGATCDKASGSPHNFTTPQSYTVTGGTVTRVYTVTVAVRGALLVKTYDTTYGPFALNPIATLMALTPSGTANQLVEINYGDFVASLPGLTSADSFSVLWDGWFHVSQDGPGDYTFGTRSDDGSVIYLDLNGDGDFGDPGELIVDNNRDQGPTELTGTVRLTMDWVRIAIGFYENGGGEEMAARFKKGSGVAYSALDFIGGNVGYFLPAAPPANPAAANLWNFGFPGTAAVITGTNIVLALPYDGMDFTARAPTYTLSPGATCDKASGSPQNFTTPQTYTVTSANTLVTIAYQVTVTFALPTLTYNFNDGTLQGWHNRAWDTNQNSGAGGWVDLAPNVTTMPASINGGAIQPPSADDGLFVPGNNAVWVSGQTDNHLNTLWLRSPQFYLVAGRDLTAQMAQGHAYGSAPANDASVSYIAQDSVAGSTGWKGVALRRVSDGVFVLAKSKTSGDGTVQTVTFTAAELAPYVGVACTLDLINSERGGWGWLTMDNVSIPGDPSPAGQGKDIASFTFPTLGAATISGTSITLTLPYGTAVAALAPTYTLSPGAKCVPASGLIQAFTSPVHYRVTALDTTTKDYTVTLTVLPQLLGHWVSGAPNLSDTAGFRPAGTHDGVAVGNNAGLLSFSSIVPPGCSGQSLNLTAGNVGVAINNSRNTDGGYLPSYDANIATRFTVAFWAKGFPDGDWNPWVSKNGEAAGWQVRRLGGSSNPSFTMRGQPNEDFNGNTKNVNDPEWHHFAGVWDGINGIRTLYVDGEVSYTEANMGAPMRLAPGYGLVLGARDTGGSYGNWFKGLLYDVRIYSVPLAQSEVRALIPPAVGLAARSAVPVGGNMPLTVSIPSGANASAPVTVYLTNGNPTLVDVGGSTASVIPVLFPTGGASSQTLTLNGLSVGQAGLSAGASGMASASVSVWVFVAPVTPGLIGRWVAGSPHLADLSGFTPDGTHDGAFVGLSGVADNFTNDVPLGFSGQSLDLRGPVNVAVRINNTRAPDAGYLPTYDDGIASAFSVAFWAKGFPGEWAGWVTKE